MTITWPEMPLKDVVKPVLRSIPVVPGTEYRTIGVKWWGEGAYERATIDGSRTAAKALSLVRKDDLIINKIWVRHGSTAIAGEDVDGCAASGEFPTFELDLQRVLPRWLHWHTRTRNFWSRCDALSRGSSGKNRIKPELFLTIRVPLPPLPEQRRIVARIEAIAGRIEEARRLRGEAEEEADSLMRAHLNRLFGSPYYGVKGNLNIERWEKLTAVVDDVADGPHVTPTYVQDGVPFITVLNITSGRVKFGDHKFISPEDHRQFQKRARAEMGDVLLSKDGTIGVPCIVDTEREFSFFVSVALIKPKRGVLDGEFLTWVIRAPYLQERIVARSRGDMIRHLVLREIRDLVIPVPPIVEQRRIVLELSRLQDQVDGLTAMHRTSSVEVDALVPTVLDRAFRGEL